MVYQCKTQFCACQTAEGALQIECTFSFMPQSNIHQFEINRYTESKLPRNVEKSHGSHKSALDILRAFGILLGV